MPATLVLPTTLWPGPHWVPTKPQKEPAWLGASWERRPGPKGTWDTQEATLVPRPGSSASALPEGCGQGTAGSALHGRPGTVLTPLSWAGGAGGAHRTLTSVGAVFFGARPEGEKRHTSDWSPSQPHPSRRDPSWGSKNVAAGTLPAAPGVPAEHVGAQWGKQAQRRGRLMRQRDQTLTPICPGDRALGASE